MEGKVLRADGLVIKHHVSYLPKNIGRYSVAMSRMDCSKEEGMCSSAD